MLRAKKALPKSLVRFAMKLRGKLSYRDRPRITTFQGKSDSVLQGCIAYNKYGGYCVPLSSRHRPAVQRILAGKIWEPWTIEFLTSHGRHGDVVHAGTFFGDFLPALSRSSAPGAKVWAFEPNPENYRCALMTTHINGLQNVELINAGLGERQGSLFMLTVDAGGRSLGGASRVVEGRAARSEESLIPIGIVTVDETVPSDRTVAIIHLDVEGFEKPALIGALGTIQRCRPTIVLETLPEESWLSENIWPLGYEIAGTVHQNTILKSDVR